MKPSPADLQSSASKPGARRRVDRGFFAVAKVTIATMLCLVSVLALSEFALRLTGVVDVPTFRVDPQIGYYPTPDQHGAFLNKWHWEFNNRSMGTSDPYRLTNNGVLLMGDSVVYGGNQLNQADKLGPLLALDARRRIWPIAAGGWALENELKMLEANPDLLRLPTIVWVSNTGDFGGENGWTNPVQYPDHSPRSALLYVLRRTILKPRDVVDSPPSPEAARRWTTDLQHFLANYHGRLIWVLYPKKAEVGASPPNFIPLVNLLRGRAEVLDLATDPAWRAARYRDTIHPSADADRLFAQRINNVLKKGSSLP